MTDQILLTRCFSCMTKLPAPEMTCRYCGWDNHHRRNGEGMLEPCQLYHGQYLLGRAMGRGGFGVTYMGLDRNLERRVAIKEYFPRMSAYRDADSDTVRPYTGQKEQYSHGMQRALDEGHIVARMGNIPNVVQIYNAFTQNGTVYIVMEYIQGETLTALVRRQGPMAWDLALKLLHPIMRALERVHGNGFIHRDVSPDNIMINRHTNETVLLDFGAARSAEDAQEGLSVVLRPGYAPPEQYSREARQDGRTDEYAICATLYFLITGHAPEAADRRSIMDDDEARPRLGVPVPAAVEQAILKGMSIRPADRFPAMADLRHALETAIREVYGPFDPRPDGGKKPGGAVPDETVPIDDPGATIPGETVPIDDPGGTIPDETVPIDDAGGTVPDETIPIDYAGKPPDGLGDGDEDKVEVRRGGSRLKRGLLILLAVLAACAACFCVVNRSSLRNIADNITGSVSETIQAGASSATQLLQTVSAKLTDSQDSGNYTMSFDDGKLTVQNQTSGKTLEIDESVYDCVALGDIIYCVRSENGKTLFQGYNAVKDSWQVSFRLTSSSSWHLTCVDEKLFVTDGIGTVSYVDLDAGETVTFGAPNLTALTNAYAQGARNNDVVRLQEQLIALGFLKTSADGVYGKKTCAAVKACLSSLGMQSDGSPTATLLAKLFYTGS